jgi:Stress responsive A/B Barrel Domain
MVRHVVVFRFPAGTSDASLDELREALVALPGLIPQIRALSAGPDLHLRDGNADFAVVADFDDADGYRATLGHAEYLRVMDELILPHIESRHAVQLSV